MAAKSKDASDDEDEESEDMYPRIQTFMGEFRIVVPALAAIFGFQLMNAFQQTFRELNTIDKAANFAGLGCSALAMLFLLVPSNYHRMTTRLDESASFLGFAQRNYGIAFVFIPIGVTLSLYVQAVQTFQSRPLAAGLGAFFLVAFAIGWWLVPYWKAHRRGTLPTKGETRARRQKTSA